MLNVQPYFFYPPEWLMEVIDYVCSQKPQNLRSDVSGTASMEDKKKIRELVLLQRKGDGHHILTALHEHGVRVLTYMGVQAEGHDE